MRFDGTTYDPAFDKDRLQRQIGRIYSCMIDGKWRTFSEIQKITQDPEASISAQLRNLRKERFGAYVINRRPRGDRSDGLYEYQVLKPHPSFNFDKDGQGEFL